MSDSSSSNSVLPNESYYRRKRLKKRRAIGKNYPIKLYVRLMEKLLTTVYKSKIIKFKLYKYPLKFRIYYLAFVKSLDMTFTGIKKLVRYSYIIQK